MSGSSALPLRPPALSYSFLMPSTKPKLVQSPATAPASGTSSPRVPLDLKLQMPITRHQNPGARTIPITNASPVSSPRPRAPPRAPVPPPPPPAAASASASARPQPHAVKCTDATAKPGKKAAAADPQRARINKVISGRQLKKARRAESNTTPLDPPDGDKLIAMENKRIRKAMKERFDSITRKGTMLVCVS